MPAEHPHDSLRALLDQGPPLRAKVRTLIEQSELTLANAHALRDRLRSLTRVVFPLGARIAARQAAAERPPRPRPTAPPPATASF